MFARPAMRLLALGAILRLALGVVVRHQAVRPQLLQKANVSAATSVLATAKSGRAAGHHGTLFHKLLVDWKEVPDVESFTSRCVNLISKLMPTLRREYTAQNVPTVLIHECDVYATKEDYIVANFSSVQEARDSCRYSARRLGAEFLGGKDYKSWCLDLHAYLDEQRLRRQKKAEREGLMNEQQTLQAQLDKLKAEYNEMLRKKESISGELDKLSRHLTYGNESLQCCPSNCRPC